MTPGYHPLGRKPAQRRMLLRNLVTSLILYESIRTTVTRAKIVKPLLEKLIHKAKSRPVHIAVRALNQVLTDKNASRKTMEVLVPRFERRTSGFTRTARVGRRIGDGADLVELSLLDAPTSSAKS